MLKSLIKSKFRQKKAELFGVVEVVNSRLICGWVLDHKAPSETLLLELQGNVHELPIQRTERADVAQQHGAVNLNAGFDCPLPPDLRQALNRTLVSGAIPNISINGRRLQTVAIAGKYSAVQGSLERIDPFRLQGWVVSDSIRPSVIELRIGSRTYPLRPIWLERSDVAKTLRIEDERVGFSVELPGCIWEAVGENSMRCEAITLELLADGEPFHPPHQLTKRMVADWIDAVCREPEEQYLLLCAIEHFHFGRLEKYILTSSDTKLREFAARFGLQDYLSHSPLSVDSVTGVDRWETESHWRALRELNTEITNVSTSEDLWRAVLETKERQFSGEVVTRYFDSLVPTLCRQNLYERLFSIDEVDAERWRSWESSDDAWRMTIAIPAWLEARRFDKVTAILWRLSHQLHQGWINTECLHYSARRIMGLLTTGRIDPAQAESFIYAYFGVLDGFQGDWHSRLHDQELMNGALELLSGFDGYRDYLRRDIVRGLLRHYGLSPNFWRSAGCAEMALQHPEYVEALRSWEVIYYYLSQSPSDPNWQKIVMALRYFDHLGNRSARHYAREIIASRLAEINADPEHPAQALLDFLLQDNVDGVRYAAFPMATASNLHNHHVACGSLLGETLRSLSKRHKNPSYATHRELGALISNFALVLLSKPGEEYAAISRFSKRLTSLVKQRDLLAIDLLSWLVRTDKVELKNFVHMLTKAVMDELEVAKEWEPPPAPLLAALARALPVFSADTLKAFAASNFGNRLQFTLDLMQPKCGTLAMSALNEHWPGDTLVVIYSCRKYLDSRIAAIRETWVKDLRARGIPYVVLVGDGDDTIQEDVLALDVSDRYEDLPQKTLKLVDWVLHHTNFQYLYKIDDDCYLSVERFFENLTYRKHHYYGRVVKRGVGSMDRTWHQDKSQTEHARKSIDKSPEPSVYADGGGGYVLSRFAMHALNVAAQTEAGQRLISVSLMEDKLVGDLLSLSAIAPSDEEYESYQRRRTFGAAVPVGMWDNLFFPSACTPTVMSHLDTDRDQQAVHAMRSGKELLPKKIWETSRNILMDWADHPNQLELLSPTERLHDVLAHSLYVVSVMRNEMTLLPHFLAHYRSLGVKCFLIADNCSDDGTREYLLEQSDVALFSADTEYKNSHFGVAWQQAILGNFCLGRWALLADADELFIYPDCETTPISEFLAEKEAEDVDAVRIAMIDMYPYGDLAEADFTKTSPFDTASWFDQPPLIPWHLGSGFYSNAIANVSALRHRIDSMAEPNAFNSMKTALIRYQPWMRLSKGLHDASGVKLSSKWACFAHFKYHNGFKEKIAIEIMRGQHYENAKEYKRYQAMLAEGQGSFGVDGVSVKYDGVSNIELFGRG